MLERARKFSRVQQIGISISLFLVLCCGCLGVTTPDNEPEEAASSEIIENKQEAAAIDSSSESGKQATSTNTRTSPTKTAKPTNTPQPTSTSKPTATPTDEPESGEITLADGEEIEGEVATVTQIIDGDTIEVDLNGRSYRVRYIGMDTPERGDPYFDEATEANRQLVEDQTIIMVKDVSETDRYGRLLRYIYLQDGTFVNAELVKEGFALVATFPPDVAHVDEFTALYEEAREAGRGLWGQPVAASTAVPSHTPQPTSPPLPTNTSLPVVTVTPAAQSTNTPEPPPTAVLPPTTEPPTAVPVPPTEPPPPPSNCHPAYPTVCILPPPPDLDCGEIPFKDFQVLEPDPHGFDRDNDGIGCES